MAEIRIMLADYSEIDSLDEILFDRDSSPFYDNSRGDYYDLKHEQINATCMEMTLEDIRKVVDKIGVFELMDMVKDEYGDDFLGIMEKTIDMRYRSLMFFVLKEYIQEQEMVMEIEIEDEEQIDSDTASSADTDEETDEEY